MKKLLLSTAIATALFAVNVSAAIPLANGKVDFTTETGIQNAANLAGTAYLAGSSAATPFIENTVIRQAGEGTTVYKYTDSNKDLTYVFSTGDTVLTGSTLAPNSTYVVNKRDKGGSVSGTLSASNPTNRALIKYHTLAGLDTLNAGASCAAATQPLLATNVTTRLVVCTTATVITQAAAPSSDFVLNLSDVDAVQFASSINGATEANTLGTTAADIVSTPMATQVYGIALTLKLRNAMQVAAVASGALPAACASTNLSPAIAAVAAHGVIPAQPEVLHRAAVFPKPGTPEIGIITKAVAPVNYVAHVPAVKAAKEIAFKAAVGVFGTPGYKPAVEFKAAVRAVKEVKQVLAVAGQAKTTKVTPATLEVFYQPEVAYKAAVAEQPASAGTPAVAAGTNRESEACMVSLTTSEISSIFAGGRFNSWDKLTFGGAAGQNLLAVNSANAPGNPAVHICSRTAGSGTLAITNLVFENAPCSAVNDAIQAGSAQGTATGQAFQASGLGSIATAIAEKRFTTSAFQNIEGANGLSKAYHSNESGSTVPLCLSALDGYTAANAPVDAMVTNGKFILPTMSGTANFRWAVGIMNADSNPTNVLPYRFAKIDGYSPSLVNVAQGKYKFWSEIAVMGDLPTTASPLAYSIHKELQNPTTIALSNVNHVNFGATGFMGMASMAANADAIAPGTLMGAAYDVLRPVNPFTHANEVGGVTTVNHCRATAVSGGNIANMPGLN